MSEKQAKGSVKKLVLKKETVKSLKLRTGVRTGADVGSLFNTTNGGLSAGYGGPPKWDPTQQSCNVIVSGGGVIIDP